MKKNIIVIVALFIIAITSNAQSFKLSIEGFEMKKNTETVRIRTIHYIHGDKVFALWQSVDMNTWTRVELEYGKDTVVEVDSGQMPQYDYYVKKGARAFFKIDTYIPKGFLFTRNLTVGSTGEDVSNLQTFLQQNGLMEWWPDMEKGYFGNQTAAALAAYQQSVGISPAGGYFGPLTRSYVNIQIQ